VAAVWLAVNWQASRTKEGRSKVAEAQNDPPQQPAPLPEPKPKWLWALLVIIALTLLMGALLPRSAGLFWPWIIALILMFASFAVIGLSRGMGVLGILIDAGRNMMSLSRLQIVLWTGLILSAFVTAALARAWDYKFNQAAYVCATAETAEASEGEEPCADPLGIQLPTLLWALMGISITSAVASPLLKDNKAQRTAEQDRLAKSKAARSSPPALMPPTYSAVLKQRKDINLSIEQAVGDTEPVGVMVRKESWAEADFSDVFTGEEVSTFGYVDIAKVQNFFFTIVAWVAYAVVLGVAMGQVGTDLFKFVAFPALPAGLIAVIAISHAGYLTDKAFVHSVPE
jgi:hypothetical protein